MSGAVVGALAAVLVAASPVPVASPGGEELPDCMPWAYLVDHPDHTDEPDSPFDFAFDGAPEEITAGSGPHAFRVWITDFAGVQPTRWDLDVVDVRNRARHVEEARIEYADARGTWRPVTWKTLQDAPGFPVPPRKNPYDVALRVTVPEGARVEKAALVFSAAKEELPVEWMPHCLLIARSGDPATAAASRTASPRPAASGNGRDGGSTGPLETAALAVAAATGTALAALALRARRERHGARQERS